MNTMVKFFFIVAFIACAAGVLITHSRLIAMERSTPELLARVGIRRIDWWWGCVRGIYRLAFSPAGNEVPQRTRLAFIFALTMYPLVIISMLAKYLGLV